MAAASAPAAERAAIRTGRFSAKADSRDGHPGEGRAHHANPSHAVREDPIGGLHDPVEQVVQSGRAGRTGQRNVQIVRDRKQERGDGEAIEQARKGARIEQPGAAPDLNRAYRVALSPQGLRPACTCLPGPVPSGCVGWLRGFEPLTSRATTWHSKPAELKPPRRPRL